MDDKKLYKKAFELIEQNKTEILKNVKDFKEFRSKVSSLSVGMIICNPKQYYESLLNSNKLKKINRLIMETVIELMKEDSRDDLASFVTKNNVDKLEELKYKKESQKYFTIIKDCVNLEKFEETENGKQ